MQDFESTCDMAYPYFGATSAPLGELHDMGFFDWEDESWHWDSYNEEQYTRVCKKILNRYQYRELGVLPAARWKDAYLRKMNEIMPKYKMLYSRLDEGINPFQSGSNYEKERNIFSDFPATHLSGNSDYTSSGNDRERENVNEGDILDKMNEFSNRYRDIDVMILDELDCLFSCLLTATVPVY